MKMLEECINEIFRKSEVTRYEDDKELYKSIYHHLCDYKDILNKTTELTEEIEKITNRWDMIKKANAE